MTTTTHAPGKAGRAYEAELHRELAVLPRRSRRGLLQDASEHAAGTADEQEFADSFGDPAVIARTALEQHDADARRPLRPSLLMPSKLLQLGAAVLASPLAVMAVIDFFISGFASDPIFGLLKIALWALIALPPLLARWTTWWKSSLLCASVQACYLTIAFIVVIGGWNVPAAGVVFLVNGPLAALYGLAFALCIVALIRAPKVLQTH